MHVTREGPDLTWSRDCPVRAFGPGEAIDARSTWRLGMAVIEGVCRIVGGVDTHKDLHVAAIVDEQDRVIGTRSFATTRQGYRQMLAWMSSFGELQRIGIESSGSYGAGLLRFMHGRRSERRDRRSCPGGDDPCLSGVVTSRTTTPDCTPPLQASGP